MGRVIEYALAGHNNGASIGVPDRFLNSLQERFWSSVNRPN